MRNACWPLALEHLAAKGTFYHASSSLQFDGKAISAVLTEPVMTGQFLEVNAAIRAKGTSLQGSSPWLWKTL